MFCRRCCPLVAVCAVAIHISLWSAGTAAATQGREVGGAPSIPDRLARLERALFSASADFPAAIRDLKAILAIDPRSRDAHVLLGIAYRGLGTQEFTAEAVAEFRQALALDLRHAPARLYLADAYRDLGRLERAREELQTALAQVPGNPQVLALLGDTERRLRNPARALELEEQALKVDQGFLQARYYFGLALLDLGKRDQAIRELEAVIQSGAPAAEPYLSLGTAYLDAQRVPEAIDVLTRGLRIDVSRPDLHIQLARALRTQGALAESEVELARAAAGHTRSRLDAQQVEFDLALERGLLKLAQRQLPSAVRAFETALALDPDHGATNRGLAEVYLLEGKYAPAAEHAARAEKAGAPLSEALRALLRKGRGGGPGPA